MSQINELLKGWADRVWGVSLGRLVDLMLFGPWQHFPSSAWLDFLNSSVVGLSNFMGMGFFCVGIVSRVSIQSF